PSTPGASPGAAPGTTRAPRRVAMACDPSVLLLSATITSPSILFSRNARCAFSIHVARVSASFRHGMTTDTSGAQDGVEVSCSIGYSLPHRLPRCIGEIFGGRRQLSVYKGVVDA